MSEDATVILIMLFWATVAYAAYQRFFVVRRLRKRLDRLVDATLTPTARPAVLPSVALDDGEWRRVQDRLKVLERIAVEKEDTLSREIEELRAASR